MNSITIDGDKIVLQCKSRKAAHEASEILLHFTRGTLSIEESLLFLHSLNEEELRFFKELPRRRPIGVE